MRSCCYCKPCLLIKMRLLFRSIFSDTLGFAGVEMIRRIVGQLATTFVLLVLMCRVKDNDGDGLF